MKNEKHVALAKEIWLDSQFTGEEKPEQGFIKGVTYSDPIKLIDMIAAALQQIESEALASKVELPTDETIKIAAKKDIGLHREDNRPKTCTNNDFYMAVTSAFERGAKWALSRLTLAPNEPEVKAQEWAEKKASDIVNKFLHKPITDTYLCILKDEIIAVLLDAVDISKKYEKHDQSKTLNEKSDIPRSEVKAQGFEELFNLKIKPLLNSSEAFVTYAPYEWFLEFFKAGQKSQATTLKLPERRIDNPEDMQWTAMETQGWNDCLDAVKALNEGDV